MSELYSTFSKIFHTLEMNVATPPVSVTAGSAGGRLSRPEPPPMA